MHSTKDNDIPAVKILHELDQVMEGGEAVLTLKDQNILADGNINEDADVLENVRIREQNHRGNAYMDAKRKASECFTDEAAEKKLPKGELYDLTSCSTKPSSDYYTQEEMLRFKKHKKKVSLRKKEKLDFNSTHEAVSVISSGAELGTGDLGSRSDRSWQSVKEEEKRAEEDQMRMRRNARLAAYAKAQEACEALSEKSGIASLPLVSINQSVEAQTPSRESEPRENRFVFPEIQNFDEGCEVVINEDTDSEDHQVLKPSDQQETKDGHFVQVQEETVPDAIFREAPVGKGLSGALKWLDQRGLLKETTEEDDSKEVFRSFCHKFHGQKSGKRKQEKRMKQHQQELMFQSMDSNTLLHSVERMRDAQAQSKTPFFVLPAGKNRNVITTSGF